MSSFLIIYIDENIKFDRSQVIQAISSIDNTNNIQITKKNSEDEKTFKSVLFCFYDFGKESVEIRVDRDLKAIFVKRFCTAALKFTLELQRKLNISLFATDCDYSFLGKIENNTSLKEFEGIVSEGIYMNE